MIALFFEVTPRAGQDDRYLEIAGTLRPALEASGGVLYLDRFRSLSRPRVLLSHQLWQDEASLARWRANDRHHGAQTAGRTAVFEDYRLRIGPVVATGHSTSGIIETAPGITYNDPARHPERYVAVVRSTRTPFDGRSGEVYRSVYDANQFAWIAALPDRNAGLAVLRAAAPSACVSAAQLCLLSRDYGMFDRNEAPQYFPAST